MARAIAKVGSSWLVGAWLLSGGAALASGMPSPSAVSPATLELPSGPGSVEGLSDAATLETFSGQLSYGFDVDVPKGLGGLAPSLALAYHGGSGNSIVGVGWALKVASIQRSPRHGVPTYTTSDELELAGTVSGRLVALEDGSYALEGAGRRVQVRELTDETEVAYFEMVDGSSKVYRFGSSSSSRIARGQDVQTWLLDQVTDVTGNTIQFSYASSDSLANPYQRSLDRIEWGPGGAFSVDLVYETRPDPVTSYRAGFPLITEERVASIEVGSFGELLRTYHLTYDNLFPLSRLTTVTLQGRGTNGELLPPLELSYAELPEPTEVLIDTEGWQLNTRGVTLVDVDGDGASDLARLEYDRWLYKRNRGCVEDAEGVVSCSFDPPVQLASGMQNGLESVRLMDLTGDARADAVYVVDDTWRVYGITQTGLTPHGRWLGSSGVPLHNDESVVFADINGDGRTDVVRQKASGLAIHLAGDSMVYEPFSVGPVSDIDAYVEIGKANVRLQDMNGDSLADVVFLGNEWLKVFYGRGDGTFEASSPILYPWGWRYEDLTDIRLADLNRDGLTGLVRFCAGNVYWYRGEAEGFDPIPVVFERPPGASYDDVVTMADVNGNGSEDVVWSTEYGLWVVDIAGSTSAGMLTRIDNGLGKSTTFEYQSSTDVAFAAERQGEPWTHHVPSAMPVAVASVVDVGDGSPQRRTEYTLRDGVWDTTERQLAGFLASEARAMGDSATDTAITQVTYHPGLDSERSLRGKVLQERVEDAAGTLFSETIHGWELLHLDDMLDHPWLRVAVETSTEVHTYEGAEVPLVTRVENTFDSATGELVAVDDFGRTDLSGDEVHVRRDFATFTSSGAGAFEHAWGRVCAERIYRALPTTNSDEGLVSHVRTTFGSSDTIDTLCTTGPHGWTRMVESQLFPLHPDDAATAGVCVSIDTTARWVTKSEIDYDTVGNPIRTLEGGVERYLEYDANQLHPEAEWLVAATDEDPLRWELEWDDVLGAPVELTDPNDQSTFVYYDSLGRVIGIGQGTSAQASADVTPHQVFSYDWTAPRPKTHTYVFHGDASSLTALEIPVPAGSSWVESVAVANGAGEPLYVATACPDCVGTSQEAPDLGGLPVTWQISGWSNRDARGFDAEVYEPFYIADSSLPTSLPDANIRKHILEYDAFGRLLSDTDPGLDTTITTYEPFATVVSTPELADVITHFDGQDRPLWTRQDIDGHKRTILAAYNPLGSIEQLTVQATDPDTGDVTSVVQEYGHDSWGQLLYLTSPDAGRRQYIYNDFGQLVDLYNGECDQQSYTYDNAGRLTSQQLLGATRADGSVVESVLYQFLYDASDTDALLTQANLRGRLATVLEDNDDRMDVTYDNLGRQTGWVRRVQGEKLDEEVELSMSGRVLRTSSSTMSLSISRQYDSLSRPTFVQGFWQASEIDAAGRMVDETYDNGVTQSYGYDVKGLPSSILGERPMGAGIVETFLHQTATRTAFGSVASITDLVHDGATPLDGFSHDAAFSYDAAGRLTSSVLGPEASPVGVTIQYDGLDNIVERTTTGVGDIGILTGTYQYGTATDGPRQLRSTTLPSGDSGATFGYDLAGRLVHEDNNKRVFDALDNLVEVELGATSTPGTGSVTYAYGYDRLRKTATYPDGQVDRWFSESTLLRNNAFEVYVSSGSRVVGKLTLDRDELAAALAAASTQASQATALRAHKAAAGSLLALLGLLMAMGLRPWHGVPRRWVRATASLALLSFGVGACGLTSGQRSTPQELSQVALAFETGVRQFFHPGFRPGPAVITTQANADGEVAIFKERRVSPFGVPIDALREEVPGEPTVASSGFFAREAFGALEKQHDHATGYTHHVARWMAPQLGRWLTPDPLFLADPSKSFESPGESGLYAYALNNPIGFADLTGTQGFAYVRALAASYGYRYNSGDTSGVGTPVVELLEQATFGRIKEGLRNIDAGLAYFEQSLSRPLVPFAPPGDVRARWGMAQTISGVGQVAEGIHNTVTAVSLAGGGATALSRRLLLRAPKWGTAARKFGSLNLGKLKPNGGGPDGGLTFSFRSELLGNKFPAKTGAGGRMQPWDPNTGRYLPFKANSGLKTSPLARFTGGFGHGFAEAKGSVGAAPMGTAGNIGYALGWLVGNVF